MPQWETISNLEGGVMTGSGLPADNRMLLVVMGSASPSSFLAEWLAGLLGASTAAGRPSQAAAWQQNSLNSSGPACSPVCVN